MATQRLSTWLALRCKEEPFRRFLGVPDEATAADTVRALCGVKSRSEIDSNPEAQYLFHRRVRIPFIDYSRSNHN